MSAVAHIGQFFRVRRERKLFNRFAEEFRELPMKVDLKIARITYEQSMVEIERMPDGQRKWELKIHLTVHYNQVCAHIVTGHAMGFV